MYIVNTSFFVDPGVQNAWLEIIREKYIPFLVNEGCSIVAFSRVVSNEPADHFTYSLLAEAENLEHYSRYVEELFAEYERLSGAVFGEKVTTFTTLLKKLD